MNNIILKNLTFKTTSYRKNYDITHEYDNFITEHEGVISKVRMDEFKPPFQVGEYQFTTWNIKLAKEFNIDLIEYLDYYIYENTYNEMQYLLHNKKLSLKNVNKLILLHTYIIHPNYRKKGVTEEFIEFLYRDFVFGNENNLLIALIKPIQTNPIDYDYFSYEKIITTKDSIEKNEEYKKISGNNHYKIDELTKNDDIEIIEYKLFALAKRLGFERISESHLFKLNPSIIKEKIGEKQKYDNDDINDIPF